MVGQATVDEGIRRGANVLLTDGFAPAIPRIPAHWRGETDVVTDDNTHFSPGAAPVVFDGELYGEFSGFLGSARDQPIGPIDRQTGRQTTGDKCHRFVTAGGNPEQEGGTRAGAKDLRAIDARRCTGRRGQNLAARIIGRRNRFLNGLGYRLGGNRYKRGGRKHHGERGGK